jgi:hypothetical protein
MKLVVCFIIFFVISSCGKPSPIQRKLSLSDSLIITFNIPDTDSVINTVSTTEPKAIKKITGFLNGKTRDGNPCGYDGHLDFFSKGQLLQQVIFSYHADSCRQFIFDLDNKVQATEVSNEAKRFFQSLGAGRNWY